MNLLCIDWGQQRIGLAFVDLVVMIPVALETIDRNPWHLTRTKLDMICKTRHVTQIVIGWPSNLDDTPTARCGMISSAIDLLTTAGFPPITKHNEYGTSKLAQHHCDALGVKRKRHIDHYAALHILQDYLRTQSIED